MKRLDNKVAIVTGASKGIGAGIAKSFGAEGAAASGEKPTVFTCADDKAARAAVIALAKEIGFEGVEAGHLDASRNIENLGLLVGQLAYGSGFGNRVTLRAYVAS